MLQGTSTCYRHVIVYHADYIPRVSIRLYAISGIYVCTYHATLVCSSLTYMLIVRVIVNLLGAISLVNKCQ
jgi:hypothetical protein